MTLLAQDQAHVVHRQKEHEGNTRDAREHAEQGQEPPHIARMPGRAGMSQQQPHALSEQGVVLEATVSQPFVGQAACALVPRSSSSSNRRLRASLDWKPNRCSLV